MTIKEREEIFLEFVDGLLRLYLFKLSSSGVVLDKFHVAPCSSIREKEPLEKALSLLFNKIDYTEQNVIVVLPDTGSAQRYLKLPTLNEDELRAMVVNHSLNFVPYTQDELLIAYSLVKKDQEGYSDVLSLMLAKEECQLLLKQLIERDIVVVALYVKPMAFASLVAQKKKLPSEVESLVLYKEQNMLCLMVMRGENLALYRSTEYLDDKQELKSFIFKTLSLYVRSSSGGPVNELFFCGDFKDVESLETFLKDEFTMNVTFLDIEDWTKYPNNLRISHFAKNCLPVFALAHDKLYSGLNMLPLAMRINNQFWHILKRRFLVLFLWVCFCFMFLITGALKGFKLQSALKTLNSVHKRQELQATSLVSMQKKIKVFDTKKEELSFNLDFFHLLNSSLPRGIVVEEISSWKKDERFYRLLARAETRDQVYEAVDIMKDLGLFLEDKIKINYLTSVDDRGKERFIFELMFSSEKKNADT